MTIVSYYTKEVGAPNIIGPYSRMSSSRQKRPYVSANFHRVRTVNPPNEFGTSASGVGQQAFNLAYEPMGKPLSMTARGIAYTRFMGKALPQAALLVNAAQGKQAWEMIANRSIQLVKAFSALKRGNLLEFARVLLLDPSTVRRHTTRQKAIKDPSGTWLEFTFGWVPLITDIYTSVDILQRDFELVACRGSSRLYEYTFSGTAPFTTHVTRFVQARVRADIVVTNPNLMLANQLGLLNPAAVVWDIIPFSFVVDWFLPVGRFIKQFNDQAGIRLQNEVTTVKMDLDYKSTVSAWIGGRPNQQFTASATANSCQRLVGPLVKPGFPTNIKLPTGSMWLAATSVALLTQIFRK